MLCLSDVLALCGNESRAIQAAKKAVVELGPLRNVAYAGPYARWVARVGLRAGDPATALASILTVFGRGEGLDPKDRAEVLAAVILLRSASGHEHSEDTRLLSDELRKLPVGIVRTMRQLKMLPSEAGDCGAK
jgi:hypothetical protein